MLIVNADDLAMTPGANQGIFEGFDKGAITHASIMANCDFFDEAMQGLQERPNLGLGMHLNITYGKPLIQNSLYCNREGIFNLGYLDLLKNRSNKLLEAIEAEWEAQIQRVLQATNNRELTHLDSHRHVHMIPHLYKITVKLAKKYNIKRIRLINENIFHSLALTKRLNFIINGGIIKYLLLRFFTALDAKYENMYKNINFYSIVYTGVIGGDILNKLQNSKETYEIMVHPSVTALDRDVHFYDEAEKAYRISKDREKELKAVLALNR